MLSPMIAAAEPTAIAIQGSMRPVEAATPESSRVVSPGSGNTPPFRARRARRSRCSRSARRGRAGAPARCSARSGDVGPDERRDDHHEDGGDRVDTSAAAGRGAGAATARSLTPSPVSHRSMPFHAPRPRNRPLRHALGTPCRRPATRARRPVADARCRRDARADGRGGGARAASAGAVSRICRRAGSGARGLRRVRSSDPSASR